MRPSFDERARKVAITCHLPKKQRSSVSDGKRVSAAQDISPKALALKLVKVSKDLEDKKIESIDLIGFDMKVGVDEAVEEFFHHREKVRRLMGNPKWFDNTSQVDLDYTAAALGGARVLVDQTRTTRSISKKLISYCGLKEEEFLYDGLKLNDSELKAVEELNKNRQASVVESFVDFQKQIRFKMIVLSHLAEKLAASTPESSQVDRKRVMEKPTITPARKSYASPLDFDRILESYAFDVASKIADRSKKRKITGIPFSIHLLDRDEE